MPTLLDFQQRDSSILQTLLLKEQKNALLIGGTGVGKTFILGDLIQNFIIQRKAEIEAHPSFPIFYITQTGGAVQQTQEVLYGEFGLSPKKVLVLGYSTLRAQIGSLWVTWQKKFTENLQSEYEEPYWRPELKPLLLICDECQALRHKSTQQTEIITKWIIQSTSKDNIILASATPFTKVSEAMVTTIALKPRFTGMGPITMQNWDRFAKQISGDYAPEDLNAAAVKRLTGQIEEQIVRVKGVKFKKRTFTKCVLIDFENPFDAKRYATAFDKYLSALAKINRSAPGGIFQIFVEQTKFRKEAELIRAPYMARHGIHVRTKEKKQVIIASNYVGTLEAVKEELLKNGVLLEKISIIVGGQKRETRKDNIQRFQTGVSDYCLFTLKSGGVGLSLHHNPKNEKTCLPRFIILPPTWSAIEIVQALGRGHRINSISTTRQIIMWYRGTMEELVADRLGHKLHCLGELVGKKETWTGVMSNREELDSITELKEINENETIDKDEEGLTEEFAAEAYDNNETETELIETT